MTYLIIWIILHIEPLEYGPYIKNKLLLLIIIIMNMNYWSLFKRKEFKWNEMFQSLRMVKEVELKRKTFVEYL